MKSLEPCSVCQSNNIEIAYNTQWGLVYCLDCGNEMETAAKIVKKKCTEGYYVCETRTHKATKKRMIKLWNTKILVIPDRKLTKTEYKFYKAFQRPASYMETM